MYAVIELLWHQYIVQEGQDLIVDKMDFESGQDFDVRVLMLFSEDGKVTTIGQPFVENASVNFEVKSHQKWKKIRVVKFHRKNRYERNIGHRSHQTVLAVTAIHGY